MDARKDIADAELLLGPDLRTLLRGLELAGEDDPARARSLITLSDRMRTWCLVHRRVHDLRSPLNSLSLTAQVLEQVLQELPPAAAELLETLHRDIERVAAGLEQLARVVRDEPAQTERADLLALVREVATLAAPAVESAGAALELELPESALEVDCVPSWTRHALLRLVLEPLPRATRLRLEVRAQGRDGEVLLEHDGAALQEDDAQADTARQLVRAQGGRIEREARDGGVRVRLRLPGWHADA